MWPFCPTCSRLFVCTTPGSVILPAGNLCHPYWVQQHLRAYHSCCNWTLKLQELRKKTHKFGTGMQELTSCTDEQEKALQMSRAKFCKNKAKHSIWFLLVALLSCLNSQKYWVLYILYISLPVLHYFSHSSNTWSCPKVGVIWAFIFLNNLLCKQVETIKFAHPNFIYSAISKLRNGWQKHLPN